jgi:hypothetical protein
MKQLLPVLAVSSPAARYYATGINYRNRSLAQAEKLEFLLVEDAVSADPAVRFHLKHLITEARNKIRSLEGRN